LGVRRFNQWNDEQNQTNHAIGITPDCWRSTSGDGFYVLIFRSGELQIDIGSGVPINFDETLDVTANDHRVKPW